jgi:predicted nucleic acid-binding Zn ribbon protein
MNILEKEKKVNHPVTPLFFGILVTALVSYVVIFATPVLG